MKRSCTDCLFYDSCGGKKLCEYYAPIDENEETPEEHKEEQLNRREFYNAWIKYAARDDDENLTHIKQDKTFWG